MLIEVAFPLDSILIPWDRCSIPGIGSIHVPSILAPLQAVNIMAVVNTHTFFNNDSMFMMKILKFRL
jgi:hypothetical protein